MRKPEMTTPRCERGIDETVTVLNRTAANHIKEGSSHEYDDTK